MVCIQLTFLFTCQQTVRHHICSTDLPSIPPRKVLHNNYIIIILYRHVVKTIMRVVIKLRYIPSIYQVYRKHFSKKHVTKSVCICVCMYIQLLRLYPFIPLLCVP